MNQNPPESFLVACGSVNQHYGCALYFEFFLFPLPAETEMKISFIVFLKTMLLHYDVD